VFLAIFFDERLRFLKVFVLQRLEPRSNVLGAKLEPALYRNAVLPFAVRFGNHGHNFNTYQALLIMISHL
jgi:hypothetical protein